MVKPSPFLAKSDANSSRESWWTFSVEETARRLETDLKTGLTIPEARRRLDTFGPNTLTEKGIKSPWLILWEQLTGVMVVVLIIAACVSALMGETADAVVIGVIIALNALLGLTQEYRAEKAMAALKKMSVPIVKVRRGGVIQEISSRELVPGDLLILEAGNLIPADVRLVEAANLRIEEAALTGESEPVEKHTGPISGVGTSLGDRRNMAHMGTIVTYGRGVALVTATGMNTELGAIATMIQDVKREATPLQKRLAQLGKGLAVAALVLVAVIFAQGVLRGGTGIENMKLMFLTAISMAVAAVPEGLPAVVTIALALGAQRMLRRRALVRKLLAVETLGSVTVICSDKTGTLTENRMTVTVCDVAGERIDLTERLNEISSTLESLPFKRSFLDRRPGLALLAAAGALCNDAELKPPTPEIKEPRAVGDPTEGALVIVAASLGLRKEELEKVLPRVSEIPFESDRKRMTTVHRIQDLGDGLIQTLGLRSVTKGTQIAFCKGAVDGLLGVCAEAWSPEGHSHLTAEKRSEILSANNGLAATGMRVMGVSYRLLESEDAVREPERELVFLGLVGMIDPPRQEVKDAVHTCRQAGIRPVMITGDHPLTAQEIARQLDIASEGGVLTGVDLDRLSPEELAARVESVSIYARVSPEHKLKIVSALQSLGHVVAMTGDGVNDAPALRKSDIGVAMGITGTDVSKEAADMVLQDDNFATIVASVEEGRVIYDNIRKFIKYLLSTNSGELWVMLMAPILGMPLPLLPLQILWMNLVTDGLPALALGIEPAEKDIMRQKPRRTSGNIFGEGLGLHIIWVGLLMGIVSLGAGWWYQWSGRLNLAQPDGVAHFRTIIFTLLAGLQMCHVLAIRSHRQSLFTIGVASNKPLLGAVVMTLVLQLALIYLPFFQKYFETVPLSAFDLTVCFLLSTTVFWAVELEKFLTRRRLRRKG